MSNRLLFALPVAVTGAALSLTACSSGHEASKPKPRAEATQVVGGYALRHVVQTYENGTLAWDVTNQGVGSIALVEPGKSTTVTNIRCLPNGSALGDYSSAVNTSNHGPSEALLYPADAVAAIGLCQDGSVSSDVDPVAVAGLVQSQS